LFTVSYLVCFIRTETNQLHAKGAAQRFPDKVDKDPEGARELNVAASKALAKLAADRDIFVIYISTDYVFPGTPGDAPYEADAKPQPTNLYGQTKLDGERAVLDTLKQAGKEGLGVVLRVPVLYGNAETPAESAVNVLMDALWKAQTQGAEISMDHWAIRYPTNTEDIGRVCHGMSHSAFSHQVSKPRCHLNKSCQNPLKINKCVRRFR
jgi:dTDP-4-dehydrorhamnose reductase